MQWRTSADRLLLVAGAATACLVLYVRDPARGAPYPVCPFRAITGLDCPFCGTGRALHALLHGHGVRAVSFNALVVLAVPLVALASLRGRGPWTWSARSVWIAVGVLVLFAVLRNLPFAAVSWMASYR